MKYEILREVYDRGPSPTLKSTFSANSDREALIKVIDRCGYGVDEEEEESVTLESLVKNLVETNGDGCDLVFYVKNLDTGTTLFEDAFWQERENEEDW